MIGLGGATAQDAEIIRAAIRRARGSGYGGWAPYETSELKRLLLEYLPSNVVQITPSGQYDSTICAAIDAIFGKGTQAAESLKSEVGAACAYNYPPLATTGPSMAQEQLIIFDDATPAPVPTAQPTAPTKRLSDFCDLPIQVCAESQAVADALKAPMQSSCRYYQGVVKQVKGLGAANCPFPSTTRVSFNNLSSFVGKYNPCQLANLRVCPPGGTPCPIGDACIDASYPEILDTAQTQCQYNTPLRVDNSPCPSPSGMVTNDNAHRYSPCKLAQLPFCGDITTFDVPEEEGDEDNTKYVVGGLLALLAIGGIAYAATRKKKKGKRKK